ncbi:polyribonucleotide nucleotidyltransferase [Bartonella clarridgeiae 73]|uniref:Polyribonucleotide nucleotidyltransferase n=1 Tax=Bartonella clarridgeiae (strain CCUG 45776 / CIP 104772 / 73) TaxID=696125 RepID=E6YG46_BARC7|nr:polyribonucleotide nucleotidyltransferase [Bartonella clarridgeiae]WCR55558.1 MAG: Polyribonucleotide nucleotidyltransferase [Bartonella clarridgeiae]CBI75834.1 polyribonucleotide nucleotidyltransferase [Bartonella clarridgeiae 73]
MFKTHKVEIEWAGRPLILETGKIARQADGAIIATYGETVVLATVVSAKTPKPDQNFFPLTVNYQEKNYAVGKIPGGYFKRENRPNESETLISRLIDRPIRPLFVEGYKNDTQVIVSVIQHDLENNPDILAIIASSAALTLSGIPFMGPIAAARIGYCNGQYILNPNIDEMPESKLDLVVAGTENAVLMVESEAHELPENVMLNAIMFGQKSFQPVINAIIKLAEVAAKEPRDFIPENLSVLEKNMLKMVEQDLKDAYTITDKQKRHTAIDVLKEEVINKFMQKTEENCEFNTDQIATVFKHLQAKIVRQNILDTGKRIDGRNPSDVRAIQSEVGILPRTHGSALFTRGETQALVVTTLGTGEDEQYIDSLTGMYKETFLLHYNFPPFSVGEIGRIGSPGRREIGHGKLAWRAIHPMLPTKESFPYTIRTVSEITESNGSSSMATVCGTSLALMDAGVPLARPVAGIAMGLIKEGEKFAILSDILGDEDHLGDMDFKVAGTENGITSLQMDIKIDGITEEIMKIALAQAKDGRIHILNEMAKALTSARSELSEFSPRIEMMNITVDKIRDVIGSGGKVIREIVEKTGAKINIEDDGTIKIASSDLKTIEAAKHWILSIVDEPEIGAIYQGTVVKIAEFGAFVNFFGSRDGLVHISQLASERVAKTTDIVKEGDKVWVKLMGFDERGKIRLSMKVVDQQTGKELINNDSIKTEKDNNTDEKNPSEKKHRSKKKED